MYATPWAGMSRNGEIMRWTLPAEIPKKKCQIRLQKEFSGLGTGFFGVQFSISISVFPRVWILSLGCDLWFSRPNEYPDKFTYKL